MQHFRTFKHNAPELVRDHDMDTVGLNKVWRLLQRAFIWKMCLVDPAQGAAWTMQPPEPEWVAGCRVWILCR